MLLVAVAEIGDKTQLLSLYLAARYRAPLAIIAGIAVATLLNHALAALAGVWIAEAVPARTLQWVVGLAFLAFAVWALFADSLTEPTGIERTRLGVFLVTLIAFFVAEMGDKTQLATVAIAAKYGSLLATVVGTTTGMLIANVPVVFAGEKFAGKLPVHWARRIACALFALAGLATIVYGL